MISRAEPSTADRRSAEIIYITIAHIYLFFFLRGAQRKEARSERRVANLQLRQSATRKSYNNYGYFKKRGRKRAAKEKGKTLFYSAIKTNFFQKTRQALFSAEARTFSPRKCSFHFALCEVFDKKKRLRR